MIPVTKLTQEPCIFQIEEKYKNVGSSEGIEGKKDWHGGKERKKRSDDDCGRTWAEEPRVWVILRRESNFLHQKQDSRSHPVS